MSDIAPNPEDRIALFQRKEIRRTIHNNEWWFVVVDVVAALSDAADPVDYLNKVRLRADPGNRRSRTRHQTHPRPFQNQRLL